MIVITNIILIAVASRYLTALDFSKFLLFNLIITLSIVFEAGAVPIFSKASKFHLHKVCKVLEIKYYRNIAISFLIIFIISKLLHEVNLKNIFTQQVITELTYSDYTLIAWICFLKVCYAPTRGVILGRELFAKLLYIQFIDFIIKIFALSALIYSGVVTFQSILVVYLVANIFIIFFSILLRTNITWNIESQETEINLNKLQKEFKSITFGTIIWIIFSNIDKVVIGFISSVQFFTIYSISSTVAAFQNHIYGPAVPVIGQKLLRKEKGSRQTFKEISMIFVGGFIILSVVLLAVWNMLDTVLLLWLGNNVTSMSDIVMFTIYLSFIPLCHAGNSLLFHFQFSFHDLWVYQRMNVIIPISNSIILVSVVFLGELQNIPFYIATTNLSLFFLNYCWIGLRLGRY